MEPEPIYNITFMINDKPFDEGIKTLTLRPLKWYELLFSRFKKVFAKKTTCGTKGG